MRRLRWRLHVAFHKLNCSTWQHGHPDDWPDEEWWDYCRTHGKRLPPIPRWFR